MLSARKAGKIGLFLSLILFTVFFFSYGIRLLPILKPNESFISFFPKKAFYEKLTSPLPLWMKKQIEKDLLPFQKAPITLYKLEQTFNKILTLKDSSSFKRYRILGNQLYRYFPVKKNISTKNPPLEKALKTLLHYVSLPDCEFILCSMDGLVEPYMDPNFYKTDTFAKQAPILAQAKRKEPFTEYIVLIPDQFSLSRTWYNDIQAVEKALPFSPWQEKEERLLWRGGFSDTGVPQERSDFLWEDSSRYKLCKLSQEYSKLIDSGFTGAGCRIVKEAIQQQHLLKPFLSKKDQLKAKYLAVLDGHMCTYPGFQWRLLSNSVPFKQDSDQIQWFYSALIPYEHYVPFKKDLSDLLEKLTWAQKEDALMQKIAQNSRNFALKNLLLADNYLYLYHLLVAYAKLQEINFTQIQKNQDPNWVCIQYRKRLQAEKSLQKLKRKFSLRKGFSKVDPVSSKEGEP